MNISFVKKFLHLIRYGAISSVWSILSIIIIKIGGPRFAAYLSYWSIDWGEIKDGQIVLCLYRESFIKDIAELRKRTSLNYPIVMGGFTRFQMTWFAPTLPEQTFYQRNLHQNDRALEKGTQYVRYLIQLVNRKYSVDAILSANFDYWQDAVFKKVCKEIDIPFLVLSREHPIIPKVCESVIARYRKSGYHFEGAAIAVAGRSTKDVITKAETICAPEQVVITGLPRYDAWLDVDTSLSLEDRKFITLLTFSRGYYADETFKEVLRLFCDVAQSYAGLPVIFIIKTKDASDTQYVRHFMTQNKLSSVRCDHELDLFDVLPKSRMVINYNSLSLVEAVMARACTVIPIWGQCSDSGEEAMYSANNPKVTKVVNFSYGKEDLLNTIDLSVKGQSTIAQDEDAREFLNEYIFISERASNCRGFEGFLSAHLRSND